MFSWLAKSIRNRLIAVYLLSISVVLMVVGYISFTTWEIVGAFEHVITDTLSEERQARDLQSEFKTQVQEWKNVLLRGNVKKDFDKYWGKFKQREASVQDKARALATSVEDPQAHQLLLAFADAHQTLTPKYQTGLEAYLRADHDPRAGDQKVRGIDREPAKLLRQAADRIAHIAASATSRAAENGVRSLELSNLALILPLLLSIAGFQFLIQRKVVTPATHLAEDLKHLADGDFQRPIQSLGNDELGKISTHAQRLRESLSHVLNQVLHTSRQLHQSAQSVGNESQQTLDSAQGQREEIFQITTAMGEMATTIQEIANSASTAASATEEANRETKAGKEILEQVTQTIFNLAQQVERTSTVIQKLGADSEAIGAILDVIKGIAEQTNLLALNAAIEAARAGEQGRGFAVVADEVRTLAKRTQKSTTEIEDMIQRVQVGATQAVEVMKQGQTLVDQGVTRAQGATGALDQIAEAVGQITDMNAQIASASEEQSAAAESIRQNLNSVQEVAESTTHSAQQTHQEGGQLLTLAVSLEQSTDGFSL